MNEDVKTKIHQMIDTITNESVLQMVSDDIEYYTQTKDIVDELNNEQLQELDDAISDVDNNESTTGMILKKK